MNTSEIRRTWAGHTAVQQLCNALDRANNSIANWFDNAVYWQRRAEVAERERDAAVARNEDVERVHESATAEAGVNPEPNMYLVRYRDGQCWWNYGWVRLKRDAQTTAERIQAFGYETEILPPAKKTQINKVKATS